MTVRRIEHGETFASLGLFRQHTNQYHERYGMEPIPADADFTRDNIFGEHLYVFSRDGIEQGYFTLVWSSPAHRPSAEMWEMNMGIYQPYRGNRIARPALNELLAAFTERPIFSNVLPGAEDDENRNRTIRLLTSCGFVGNDPFGDGWLIFMRE